MTGLLANCANPPCGQCFELLVGHQTYCSPQCRDDASLARRKARWDTGKQARKPKEHRCAPCNLTFDSGNQLGGHRSAVHVRPAHMRPAKPVNETPAPPAAQPARPRLVGTVVTVTVHETMTFTCPDCPATYTDSNRYAHHRRELHGARRTAAVEMQVTRPIYATRIA